MTGVRLELANPNDYKSPADYVEQHLAPVATELHRITNELLEPGATSAEEWLVDMVPERGFKRGDFSKLSKRLYNDAKHADFDGSAYFSLPKELLRSKQAKVQFSATVYGYPVPGGTVGTVRFRLVDSDNGFIQGSSLYTTSTMPVTLTATLPFGDYQFAVKPFKARYYIQGASSDPLFLPVCRRLSLSFIYL